MADKNYISDELLAAYLDGNTNEAETLRVLNALKADPELQEVLEIALQTEEGNASTLPVNVTFTEEILPMFQTLGVKAPRLRAQLAGYVVVHDHPVQRDPVRGHQMPGQLHSLVHH